MNFPDYDSRDYVTNNETSRPVEKPKRIWSVYYLGLQGRWIFSLPTFYYENAVKTANALTRPTMILEYTLTKEIPFLSDLPPEQKTTKIVKKIRKVRRVID